MSLEPWTTGLRPKCRDAMDGNERRAGSDAPDNRVNIIKLDPAQTAQNLAKT